MAWKSNSHAEEVKRLTQLLSHYEDENVYQRRLLEESTANQESSSRRIHDLEQENVQLSKKIRSLEISLKFEKVASEGARKKIHTMEIDLIDLRERNQNLCTEADILKEREKALTVTLQQERISRLQLFHEKERLEREEEKVRHRLRSAEKDNVASHRRLLEKLQLLETLLAQIQLQERMISAQTEEMVTLNREVARKEEECMQMQRILGEHSGAHAKYNRSLDIMQQEISRLRNELSNLADTSSQRSHSVWNAEMSPAQRNLVNSVNQLTSQRFEESSFTIDHVFSTRATLSASQGLASQGSSGLQSTGRSRSPSSRPARATPQSPVKPVTPLVSAQRPRSTMDDPAKPAYFDSQERREMLNWIRQTGSRELPQPGSQSSPSSSSAQLSFTLPQLRSTADISSPSTSLSEQQLRKVGQKRQGALLKKSSTSEGRRTLFVGSGLGFRHNAALDEDLHRLQQGSTKQILRRMLGDGD